MADVTGALAHEYDGRTYSLRLTLGGIGKLQERHGNDLGGMLSGKFDTPDDAPADFRAPIPPFSIMVDIVAEALAKGERMGADDAADLADMMFTADQSLVSRVLKAAFPNAKPGNARAPKPTAKA